MRIAVLGAGHMGSWLVREMTAAHEVGVLDLDRAKAESLTGVRVLSQYADLADFRPQLLINAVSLSHTVTAFSSAVPHLQPECWISDLASVKADLPGYYRAGPFRFASLHPMFGPTFANAKNLEEENVILITESDPEAAAFFREFFRRLKLNIHEYSFDEHDRLISYSLTLPFASTIVFAACLEAKTVPGTTFKKHHEIARGLLAEDDDLLAEILFNRHSLGQLSRITARLEFLKHVIRDRDTEEAKKFFRGLRRNIENVEILDSREKLC
ncbi:MAG TPA: prephenate dehydrogenase/arogenate dehydrogenase family protein [Acidobacteriota bacterium]